MHNFHCCCVVWLRHQAQFPTPRPHPAPTRRQRCRAMMRLHGNLDQENYDIHEYANRRSHSKKRRPQKSIFCVAAPAPKKKKITTRNHLTNSRKSAMIAQFDIIREDHDTDSAAVKTFVEHNPAVPHNTLVTMLRRRGAISDASNDKAAASATHSLQWLQQQQRGIYNSEEMVVFYQFLALRLDAKQVMTSWFAIAMKKQLSITKPEGLEKFSGSEGWRQKYFQRFDLVIRATTNTKPKTILERLPECIKFYRYFKDMCHKVPLRTPFFGHALSRRFHLDEAPFELRGVLQSTVDQKGAQCVQMKAQRSK